VVLCPFFFFFFFFFFCFSFFFFFLLFFLLIQTKLFVLYYTWMECNNKMQAGDYGPIVVSSTMCLAVSYVSLLRLPVKGRTFALLHAQAWSPAFSEGSKGFIARYISALLSDFPDCRPAVCNRTPIYYVWPVFDLILGLLPKTRAAFRRLRGFYWCVFRLFPRLRLFMPETTTDGGRLNIARLACCSIAEAFGPELFFPCGEATGKPVHLRS